MQQVQASVDSTSGFLSAPPSGNQPFWVTLPKTRCACIESGGRQQKNVERLEAAGSPGADFEHHMLALVDHP